MKRLKDFFDTEYDVLVKEIKTNSQEVTKGDMFVCIKGVNANRHDYIPEAISKGASCIVGSKDIDCPIPYIKVDNPDDILVDLCKINYDFDNSLRIIGITGTDGKTTTATSIQYLIGKDKCAYIGTNGISWGNFSLKTNNSTPDPTILYKYFQKFKIAGCEYVVMEASSEGFYRNRLQGLEFIVGAYTNVTWEHINIHKTFANYIAAKINLVKQSKEAFIINKDDPYYTKFMLKDKKILSYGTSPECTLYIKNYYVDDKYTNITFVYNNQEFVFLSPLLGKFNVYNLACSFLVCLTLGFDIHKLIENTLDIDVSGRMEVIDLGQPFKVIVDYAHTPNAIKAVLDFVHTLDNINKAIVVVGSAGSRDIEKRPIMGKTVIENVNYAIFTADDPRYEDPYEIAKQMAGNLDKNKYEIIIDRSQAIKKAIYMASTNDVVLALGKGNENRQKIGTNSIYYSDIEECKKWISERLMKEKS